MTHPRYVKIVTDLGTYSPKGSIHKVVGYVPHGGHSDAEGQYILEDGSYVTTDAAKPAYIHMDWRKGILFDQYRSRTPAGEYYFTRNSKGLLNLHFNSGSHWEKIGEYPTKAEAKNAAADHYFELKVKGER